uniref:General vesicular transport factor p115 n=1 Tax=Strigamia maritima TaxID=126957 RepID=T1IXS1_STRMM
MEYFKSGFKSVLGTQQGGSQPTGAEIVERLVERVEASTLLDDRRDAVRALKALSKKYRLEVGAQGMNALVKVLETDRNETETIGYVLDTLCNVMSDQPLDDEGEDIELKQGLGEQFTEIFIKKTDNVALLLSFLEEYDFHVRWPAVKLLTCLLINKCRDVQEIVLVNPLGVSKLMDLLCDNREVIRNDALLLLTHLTRSNANIQKIVAFENAFDRLFDIVSEEGHSDGGIIVEDCLMLMLNLLKNNTSNQNYFKEGSFIQRLTSFFTLNPEVIEAGWSAQKVSNIHHMLQIVRTLVSPQNPFQVTSSCQRVMNSCGLLEQLCNILMASGVPADILTEAINTVSEVIRGNHGNQEYFATVNAPSSPPKPAIVVLLMSMVNEKQPFVLRCAVLYCFQCFLYKNELGQAQIVQTLLPTTADVGTFTAGQLLCGGLFNQDSLSTWCAAVALSHSLVENTPQKEQLLRVQLATSIGTPPVSLLQQCTSILQEGGKVQTRLGLLMLLCTWLSNCALAVGHFVSFPINIPYVSLKFEFIINLTSQVALAEGDDQERMVQGLCAFLLGICVQFNDDSVITFNKDSLCQLIVKRIGMETFLDKLNGICKHEPYILAAQKPQLKYKHPSEALFDYEFCRLFKSLEGQIIKAITTKPGDNLLNGPEENLSEEQHGLLMQYKTLIRDQDQQLHEQSRKLEDLQSEHTKALQQLEEMNSTVQQLRDQTALLKAHKGVPQNDLPVLNIQEIENLKLEIENKTKEVEERDRTIHIMIAQQQNETGDSETSVFSLQSLRDQISSLELQIKEKDVQLQQLEDNQTKKRNEDQVQQTIPNRPEELTNDVKRLEEENVSLQLELDNIRKEQDDLLVLLSEQDTKINVYKSELKALGKQVEDDDDEIDDDEDIDEPI